MRSYLCLALSLPFAFALACAAHAAEPVVNVSEPYVRLVPPSAPATGAFMLLSNSGNAARQLVAADSPVAKTVELHTHLNENGVMKMRQIKEIGIPAHGETRLKPGSYHVMLIDLKAPLQEGDGVPLTLTFDDGSVQKVVAPVRSIASTLPGAHQPAHPPAQMKH